METYNRVRQEARHLRFEHALRTKFGIEIEQSSPYRYTFETGDEFDDIWKAPKAFREEFKKFYSQENK